MASFNLFGLLSDIYFGAGHFTPYLSKEDLNSLLMTSSDFFRELSSPPTTLQSSLQLSLQLFLQSSRQPPNPLNPLSVLEDSCVPKRHID